MCWNGLQMKAVGNQIFKNVRLRAEEAERYQSWRATASRDFRRRRSVNKAMKPRAKMVGRIRCAAATANTLSSRPRHMSMTKAESHEDESAGDGYYARREEESCGAEMKFVRHERRPMHGRRPQKHLIRGTTARNVFSVIRQKRRKQTVTVLMAGSES